MALYIPSDIANIIFEYYAQMRDMKWIPFIDIQSGKLKWKINIYSAKYNNINNLLKHKKQNLPNDIIIDISVLMGGETIDIYNRLGKCICLKKEQYADKYQMIIPISKLYIEYTDENSIYSIFCLIFGRSTLRRFDYEIYQDGNIHSSLIDIHKFGYNAYSIIIEKY
jgi:hypothetical protein